MENQTNLLDLIERQENEKKSQLNFHQKWFLVFCTAAIGAAFLFCEKIVFTTEVHHRNASIIFEDKC